LPNRIVFCSRRRLLSAFLLTLPVLAAAPADAAAAPVVRAGSAAISHDPDAGTWTISASGASLVLALSDARDFSIESLSRGTPPRVIAAATADTFVRIGGQTLTFGSRAAGFVYRDAAASVDGQTVRLDATFQHAAAHINVTRHYAATNGSPAFETWTTIAPLNGAVTAADLNGFRFTVPAGPIHWLNGLQGDDPQTMRDAAFTVQHRDLAAGDRLALGATGRSSETTVPWFTIHSGSDEFFAGLLWSGAWSLTAVRSASGIDLTLGLAPMSTTVTAPLDTPHAFFGIVRGDVSDVPGALRAFVVQGLRGGRPMRSCAKRSMVRRRWAWSCSSSTPAGTSARGVLAPTISHPASARGRSTRAVFPMGSER
jgi:hypothetical protein